MGRQIGFYMADDDEPEFLEFVRSTGRVEILRSYANSPNERLDGIPVGEARRTAFQVYLCNRDVPGELRFTEDDKRKGFYHLDMSSPVIEFDSTGLKREKRVLWAGRLWAAFRMWPLEEAHSVPKAPEFDAWWRTLTKWIRRRYERVGQNLFASPRAMSLHDAGWKFEFELRPRERSEASSSEMTEPS